MAICNMVIKSKVLTSHVGIRSTFSQLDYLMDFMPPLRNHQTRMIQRPIPHGCETLPLPVRSRSASLEHFVESLKAKAVIPAWRAVPPSPRTLRVSLNFDIWPRACVSNRAWIARINPQLFFDFLISLQMTNLTKNSTI